jgi:hypothetical protein
VYHFIRTSTYFRQLNYSVRRQPGGCRQYCGYCDHRCGRRAVPQHCRDIRAYAERQRNYRHAGPFSPLHTSCWVPFLVVYPFLQLAVTCNKEKPIPFSTQNSNSSIITLVFRRLAPNYHDNSIYPWQLKPNSPKRRSHICRFVFLPAKETLPNSVHYLLKYPLQLLVLFNSFSHRTMIK